MLLCPAALQFDVQPQGRHNHRSAIAIVARIVHVLQFGASAKPAPEVCFVVELDARFELEASAWALSRFHSISTSNRLSRPINAVDRPWQL
jgi:hypothetical protein